MSFKLLQKEQVNDKELKLKHKIKPRECSINAFFKDSQTNWRLITYQGKICEPKSLQTRVAQWYHKMLLHPGETRTHETIAQHFHWPNMQKETHKVCEHCDLCQHTKRRTAANSKLGKLPAKQAEITVGNTLHRPKKTVCYTP